MPTSGGHATTTQDAGDSDQMANESPTGATSTSTGSEESEASRTTPAEPVAAPTLPAAAMTNDAAGAEAFVRYWFDTLNYAYATGDTSLVNAASTAECANCKGLMGKIVDAYEFGGRVTGAQVQVQEVVAPAPDSTGAVLVSTVYDQDEGSVVTDTGTVSERIPQESRVSFAAILQRQAGQWRMFELAR